MERIDRERSRRPAVTDGNGRPDLRDTVAEVSIGELFKRVTSDASLLVQQEISLAKVEMKESAKRLKLLGVRLAIALILAVPGTVALAAFVVIALGEAIGSYWASALIVGLILLGAAGIIVRRALAEADRIGLPRTAKSLGDDIEWGKEELRQFKRELTA